MSPICLASTHTSFKMQLIMLITAAETCWVLNRVLSALCAAPGSVFAGALSAQSLRRPLHVPASHHSLSVCKRLPCARPPSEHREVRKWWSPDWNLSFVPCTLALSHSDKPAPFKCHPGPSSRPLTHTVACLPVSASPISSFCHSI